MNESQRNVYLTAMQIDRWLPRVSLPYAATSYIKTTEIIDTIVFMEEQETLDQVTITPPINEKIIVPQVKPIISTPATTSDKTVDPVAPFSLQLMQAGNCLLLIELAMGEPFQINDPAYQLLRNILRAAQLPDSPQLLGDVIHWPLFKQASIPQGTKEAKEFLQSYLSTYLEQLPNNKCLWLIGTSAISYVTGLTEQNFYQTPILATLGQTLLTPSLELLIEQPQHKAPLWQSIRNLIPLWQP